MLMMILMINYAIFTAFDVKNNFWTKIPKNGHCEKAKNFPDSENGMKESIY